VRSKSHGEHLNNGITSTAGKEERPAYRWWDRCTP
jgi:hypothetical protein